MLPRYLTLVLICISSIFFIKVQDQEKFISAANDQAYIKDSKIQDTTFCNCFVSPQIIPVSNQGTNRIYQGIPNASCTQFQTRPELVNATTHEQVDTCFVSNVSYSWSIAIGSNVASINGSTTGSTVNVIINASGNYTLRLENTVTCSNGLTCSNFTYFNDSAVVNVPKSCSCSVDVDCQRIADEGGLRNYRGILKGGCTGEYGTSPPYLPCGISNVVWSWQVSQGANVVEIVGPSNQQTVSVRVKGTGAYELRVQANVQCSDGTNSCGEFNFDYCQDTVTSDKKCDINVEEKVDPLMNGGLQPKYNGTKKIPRDGYIVLGADGKDLDQVKFTCIPSTSCNETGSNKTIVLNSRVRFEWTVMNGEGSFADLGGLPENKSNAIGDHVIFKPPYVPLPKTANDSSVTTTVQLLVIDDNPSQPADPVVTRNVTITTRRFKNAPDEYSVTVQSPQFTPPGTPTVGNQTGACNAVGPTWELKEDLKKPEIEIADVQDKDKMVVGEWVVLFAKDQRDGDKLKMVCQSAQCENSGYEKIYEDNVDWEWSIVGGSGTNGRLLTDPRGRFIIYEAPEKLQPKKDMIEVKVRVRVKNADALKAVDVVPPEGEITLKIFRAGVKLDFPPLTWVPEAANEISLKSSLVYKDGNTWKPALAHQFRIHFFEFVKVSSERGTSMNEPEKDKAEDCRDLYLSNGDGHEAFNDKKVKNCTTKDLFVEARTKKPVKEYLIPVKSADFGSYGLFKSEATLKDKKPEYESVPAVLADVPHPVRGVINKPPEKDNRVSVPRDVDDNHIADGGWQSVGNVQVPDPAKNDVDEDNTPAGDGFKGDGLTNYEEYRGFHTITTGPAHNRLHPDRKDLFVHNPESMPMNLFRQQSGLVVHDITAEQYVNNNTRIVNFNFNPAMHKTNQMGIFLHNAVTHTTLLGNTFPTVAPPNWVQKVELYTDRITTFCTARRIDFNQKLLQVTAHELAHACNVYHHGEGNPDIPATFNAPQGLRSGNIDCIMRYDNVVIGQVEAIGSIFCTNATGTGTNANNAGFGDANARLCRGNCLGQFRVSGQNANYPKRVNANCRNN